jgi:glucose-1-phosphate adenylyltransferase
MMTADGTAYVYDFADNVIAGATDRDRGYWRDVGTLESFHAAHMDVVSPLPVCNLYNYDGPIYTSHGPFPPAKVVGSDIDQVLLSPGVVVTGSTVSRSVLSPCVYVDAGADVSGSVLMNGVRIGAGAVVRYAIVDKNVEIPPGGTLGVDPEEDRRRGFVVQDGLTVCGKDQPYF